MKKIVFAAIIIIQIFIINNNFASAQCAMCKSTVESNAKMEVTNRAKGLNAGILYLMVIPYILIGGIGYLWYKNSKRTKENRTKIVQVLNRTITN